jgi:hypothetical protein
MAARELSNLEHAARRLLEDWTAGRNLTEAANMLREALPAAPAMTEAECDAFRRAALAQYHRDGECEVDENATVSADAAWRSEGEGAYVQAWVWVPAESLTGADAKPECTCCRHWRGQVECGGVDCQRCEGCNGGED